MALTFVYEPEYRNGGWFDHERTVPSWLDRDIVEGTESVPKPLVTIEVGFVDDDDVFYAGLDGPVQLPPGADGRPRPMLPAQWQPHITVEVLPGIFLDDDLFFVPASIRALDAPTTYLKNEIRRVR